MTTTTFLCLRCDEPYLQPRRRASHFCRDCREANNRDNTRTRMRQFRTELREVGDDLRARINEGYHPLLDQYLEAAEIPEDERAPLVPDRMPAGANTPAGPDEGYSTYFHDFGKELDARRRHISNHVWWQANPHWSYELHAREKAARFLGLSD